MLKILQIGGTDMYVSSTTRRTTTVHLFSNYALSTEIVDINNGFMCRWKLRNSNSNTKKEQQNITEKANGDKLATQNETRENWFRNSRDVYVRISPPPFPPLLTFFSFLPFLYTIRPNMRPI